MKNLLNLFFPKVCEACKLQLQDNEQFICTRCRHQLPVTNFHFNEDDKVKKILYGRVRLENATALLHFSKKSIVQELLHNLKYRGHEYIGDLFGQWLGEELKTIETYKSIDIVVPVPLHKRKYRQRGYNQVTKFGQAIADALGVEYNASVLLKKQNTRTQVFKGRLKRFDDTNTRFEIDNHKALKNKHVLLIDDIITTGATIEACANVLSSIEGLKISLATIAIAD